MEAAAALAAVRATQVPLSLLTALNLIGPIWPKEKFVRNNSCFDYIVVGGGTAGCVVANRLTENPGHKVLLLEAGGNPPIQAILPTLFVTEPMSPLDWNYTSVFDNYAANSQNNYTKFTAGKVLGGSSSLAHFILVRGAVQDYNNWAEIVNDPSWRYENVLPYFKKSENLKDPEILETPYRIFHGTEGYMGVTRDPHPEADVFLESYKENGSPILLDLNGDKTIGGTQSMLTVTDGVRQSSAISYIRPIKDRANLYVLRHSHVIKIIFERRRAVAVAVIRGGKLNVYRANKEIIVCAGVFNTPKLLMHSGIGNREHLESFNIKVIADLPVGDNFQDQIGVTLVHKTAEDIVPPPPPPLTRVPFPVLINLKSLNKTQTYADYQVFGLILSHATPYVLLSCAVVFQYRPEICDKFNEHNLLRNSFYSVVTLTKPDSRGTVRLASADPFDKPVITSGHLTVKADLDNMVKYVKDYLEIGNTTYFEKVGAELIDLELIECRDYDYGSDDYWRCYVLHTAISVYHSTSTCSMGTVVDSKLKVYNVTNLRIVDASVMPKLTSGSPHAAVMMIAEKASDMIKEDSQNVCAVM